MVRWGEKRIWNCCKPDLKCHINTIVRAHRTRLWLFPLFQMLEKSSRLVVKGVRSGCVFGLLEELLSGDSSVGERVDGVHLQVWFGVVFKFITFSMPPWADRFYYHFSTRDLILHIAFQNTEKDGIWNCLIFLKC